MKIWEGNQYKEIDTPLFDKGKPAHHQTDPPSSKLAENRITKTGSRARQCQQVFEALKRHNGATSAELAEIIDIDRHITARRLPDLANVNLVERGQRRFCAVAKQLCVTWIIKG